MSSSTRRPRRRRAADAATTRRRAGSTRRASRRARAGRSRRARRSGHPRASGASARHPSRTAARRRCRAESNTTDCSMTAPSAMTTGNGRRERRAVGLVRGVGPVALVLHLEDVAVERRPLVATPSCVHASVAMSMAGWCGAIATGKACRRTSPSGCRSRGRVPRAPADAAPRGRAGCSRTRCASVATSRTRERAGVGADLERGSRRPRRSPAWRAGGRRPPSERRSDGFDEVGTVFQSRSRTTARMLRATGEPSKASRRARRPAARTATGRARPRPARARGRPTPASPAAQRSPLTALDIPPSTANAAPVANSSRRSRGRP